MCVLFIITTNFPNNILNGISPEAVLAETETLFLYTAHTELNFYI